MSKDNQPIVPHTRVPKNEVTQTEESDSGQHEDGYDTKIVDDKVYEGKKDGSVVGIPVATRVQTDGK